VQHLGDCRGANAEAQGIHFVAEGAKAASDKLVLSHGIAPGGRLGQGLQSLKGLGVFFFPGGPSCAGFADAVGRAAREVGIEFFPAAADGIDVEASDEGEEGVAAVAYVVRFEGSEPASLLLVEATHQEVDLMVQLLLLRVQTQLAVGALTRMNKNVRHDEISAAEDLKERRTLYEKSWKTFLDAAFVCRAGAS
jgi:hypothetical protein